MTSQRVANHCKLLALLILGTALASSAKVQVLVNPTTATIAVNQQQQFRATVTGTSNKAVNWAVDAIPGGNLSVGMITSSGLYTGPPTTGTHQVTASTVKAPVVTGTASVTVIAVLQSISVSPANSFISAGSTQQFTATGNYSDGSTKDLTAQATWASSNTAVATITAAGLATAVAAGSSIIGTTYQSVTGSTGLTVTPPTLQSIVVGPSNVSIATGSTQQFTATGNYSDGSSKDLTALATWASTNTAVATINSAGLAMAVAAGSTTISASYQSVTGSTGLTVISSTLQSIAVTPANVTITSGQTQQFTATGTYTDGSTKDVTASVSWSSANTAIATISNNAGSEGLATGAGAGSSTITASSGSISGSATLNVAASQHVWLITMENQSWVSSDPGALDAANPNYRRYVLNNTADMPYFNNTLLPQGVYTQSLYAKKHDSWSMWMYLASGQVPSSSSSTECLDEPNLVRSLLALNMTWRAYSEGMPSAGFQGSNTMSSSCTDTTLFTSKCGYERSHNPLINFTDTSEGGTAGIPSGCPQTTQYLNSVPMTQFSSDAAESTVANFVYITPDLGDDTHGSCSTCSYTTGQGMGHGDGSLGAGDNWLQSVIPTILARPEFQPGGDGVLIILWDEANILNAGNPIAIATDRQCTGQPGDTNNCGGHIGFFALGPNVKQNTSIAGLLHFENVERTICSMMGFASSCPGAGASAQPMQILSNAILQ